MLSRIISKLNLILGTVQFGLDYGVSNQSGKVTKLEAESILAFAKNGGVEVIDTASSYGDSEDILGELHAAESFRVITKTPHLSTTVIDTGSLQELEDAFFKSKKKIGHIDSLLIHNPADLRKKGADQLWKWLKEQKAQGEIKKIGVSVYSGEDIDLALSQAEFDVIQLPLNIFDQRLLQSGHLKKLKKAGVEIHARSLLLQGLVFMKEFNSFFNPIKNELDHFHQYCDKNQLTPLEISLAFAKSINEVDQYVLGVTSVKDLEEILRAYKREIPAIDFSAFVIDQERFVNPAKWELN